MKRTRRKTTKMMKIVTGINFFFFKCRDLSSVILLYASVEFPIFRIADEGVFFVVFSLWFSLNRYC